MLANHAPAGNDSPQGDPDYDIILAALMQTERGRAFLQEHARRNRSLETETLLSATARIENLLRSRSLEPSEPDPSNPDPSCATIPIESAAPSPPGPDESASAELPFAAVTILEMSVAESESMIIDPEPPAGSTRHEKRDPFADIRALSDLEKIALFT